MLLLVREQDLAATMTLLGRWQTAELDDPDAEPPCPCCGTAAPLVRGACSDCGLQLA